MRWHLRSRKARVNFAMPQAAFSAPRRDQLKNAIASTSSNSTGVAKLSLAIANDPPQIEEVQPVANKLGELVNALRRSASGSELLSETRRFRLRIPL